MKWASAAPALRPRGRFRSGRRFLDWLASGSHAGMEYMAVNIDLRLDPSRLLPGAQSVICLAAAYPAGKNGDASLFSIPAKVADSGLAENREASLFLPSGSGRLIARYAAARDYHKVLKRRCHALMDAIREVEPTFEGRAFVDSAPIMERTLAAMAGLGWIGRNGCLIVEGTGSYVLLCEIVCNLPLVGPPSFLGGVEPCNLAADGTSACRDLGSTCPRPLKCMADCGQCVRACPTAALRGDGTLDARRCISYLTIEHRGEIPREFWPLMGVRLFGCDACQEACPHNKPSEQQQRLHHRDHRDRIGDSKETARGEEHQERRHASAHNNSAEAHTGLRFATAWHPASSCFGESVPEPGLTDVLRWREADWDAFTRGRALRRASLAMFLRNAAIATGNSGRRELAAPLEELLARPRRVGVPSPGRAVGIGATPPCGGRHHECHQ